jgi:hypothetical protein
MNALKRLPPREQALERVRRVGKARRARPSRLLGKVGRGGGARLCPRARESFAQRNPSGPSGRAVDGGFRCAQPTLPHPTWSFSRGSEAVAIAVPTVTMISPIWTMESPIGAVTIPAIPPMISPVWTVEAVGVPPMIGAITIETIEAWAPVIGTPIVGAPMGTIAVEAVGARSPRNGAIVRIGVCSPIGRIGVIPVGGNAEAKAEGGPDEYLGGCAARNGRHRSSHQSEA